MKFYVYPAEGAVNHQYPVFDEVHEIKRLEGCAIIDRKNWQCDAGYEFVYRMIDGEYGFYSGFNQILRFTHLWRTEYYLLKFFYGEKEFDFSKTIFGVIRGVK